MSTSVNPYSSYSATPSTSKTRTGETEEDKKVINAVFDDGSKNQVKVEDFLQLMIAQLTNQDPMNPMDDTQYVTQLAQFATMQQMQELAYYSQSNFVMSLVGKEVTVARSKVGGDIEQFTGPVEKISLVNNQYTIFVDGKQFSVGQIMEVHPPVDNSGAGDKNDEVIKDLGLSLVNTKDDSATFSWETPSPEDNDDADRLRYSVYYSTNKDFDTVENVKKYGTLVGKADQTGIDEVTVEGLSAGGTYYVNVVVKDVHGKERVYQKQVVVMPYKDE